jgi:radical SAM protein with 4Fe4S-binding SPASM domain
LEKNVNIRYIILELEEGVDLKLVKEEFLNINVYEIIMYSENKIDEILPSINIKYKKKDFDQCKKLSCVDQDFDCNDISEYYYLTNKIKNSCWRNKLAVSKKGELKPCIYSEIVLGKLGQTSLNEIFKKVEKYWYLTKDKINKCKDCELRYICFDCREIAYRKYGNLYAENPNCKYNPYTGNWS